MVACVGCLLMAFFRIPSSELSTNSAVGRISLLQIAILQIICLTELKLDVTHIAMVKFIRLVQVIVLLTAFVAMVTVTVEAGPGDPDCRHIKVPWFEDDKKSKDIAEMKCWECCTKTKHQAADGGPHIFTRECICYHIPLIGDI